MEQLTFSTAAKVAGAIFAALMIGLLVLNNLQIGAQLKIVEQQRDFQAEADPLVRDGRQLATDALERQDQVRRDARDAAALIRASAPLVEDLKGTLPTVGALAESLATRNRLVTLVDEAIPAARRTPGFMDEILRIQRDTFELQRQSLAVQRETLAIQREALARIRSIDQKTGGPIPAAPVR
jgi:hypothetical protein